MTFPRMAKRTTNIVENGKGRLDAKVAKDELWVGWVGLAPLTRKGLRVGPRVRNSPNS